MSKASYPLKLPASVNAAAARLAKEDGVSLNQWIAVAIAQKIGAVETASDFLKRRAGKARAGDMLPFLDKVDRHEESRSVRQLLRFLAKLPVRHSGDWSRNDLYE